MKSITTKQLIAELQRNDPAGDMVVYFVAYGDDGEAVIAGDAKQVHTDIKHGCQTSEGDQNVLRLQILDIF